MLALIAGRGALPLAVAKAVSGEVLICGMEHSPPDQVAADHLFRLENLGGFLRWLKARGVTQVCLCGSVDRPRISVRHLGFWTIPMLPRILRALRRGDDGALRIAIALLEQAGFTVLAAHDLVPELLPPLGVQGQIRPGSEVQKLGLRGDAVSAEQAAMDLGQASVLNTDGAVAREGQDGTDAMLRGLGPEARGAVLYKAPKPGQDRRADLPVIGPETAQGAIDAGLSGIVIEFGGVMVLDYETVREKLDQAGLFFLVRNRGA